VLLIVGGAGEQAMACAVCFGDPASDLAKGAVAGVVALLGVIGFVLVAVAGTGLYWVRRGRRIEAEARAPIHEDDGR